MLPVYGLVGINNLKSEAGSALEVYPMLGELTGVRKGCGKEMTPKREKKEAVECWADHIKCD